MDTKIIQVIHQKLDELEVNNNIHILFAVESGSRGWGFESADSDYDCRFVYIHKKDWYLQVFEQRDVLELPVDKILDISGWDIKKALQLLSKSNMPLCEWLTTPVLYREKEGIRKSMLTLAQDYFSPISAIHHYLNIARKSLETIEGDTIKIKKLFYALRPIIACMYIEEHQAIPPMHLFDLFQSILLDTFLIENITALVQYKKSCIESDVIEIPRDIYNFIIKKYDYYTQYVKTLTHHKNYNKVDLNEYFLKTLEDNHGL